MPEAVSFHELRHTTFDPEPSYIREGLLPKNGLLFICGPPKSFKSFLLGNIAYNLVTGSPLFGAWRSREGDHKPGPAFDVPEPCRVLIFEQEMGYQDMLTRLFPLWKAAAPLDQGLIDSNLYIYSRDAGVMLDTAEGCERIEGIVRAVQPQVVCFDPLVEFHSADENSSQEMNRVFHNLDRLRNLLNFATIIPHHTAKDETRRGLSRSRGSSVVTGKGDAFLFLSLANASACIVDVEPTTRRERSPMRFHIKLDPQTHLFRFADWGTWAHKNKRTKGE